MSISGSIGSIPGRLTDREGGLVELVTADGRAAGLTTVADAHEWPGQLHRAFSVLLLDGQDRILLQQRAATKTRFALRWANACCGHPAPGRDVAAAASARLTEELGLRLDDLRPAGVYVYRAGDSVSGRVEHEYDHVLVAHVDAGVALAPDPTEVAEVRWVSVEDLRTGLTEDPAAYAPWLSGVLSTWHAGAR